MRALVLTLVLGLAAASVAAAQETGAEALRRQGRAALGEGRFEAALSLFLTAAEAEGVDPTVWLEVGDAADRLRRDPVALTAYETYLEARPEAPDRVEVAARVAVLRARLAPQPEPRPRLRHGLVGWDGRPLPSSAEIFDLNAGDEAPRVPSDLVGWDGRPRPSSLELFRIFPTAAPRRGPARRLARPY